jgi:hypothetical protein
LKFTKFGNYLLEIKRVQQEDYQIITKERYFFNWQEERFYEVYKLQVKNSTDILGLISLRHIPEEWRIHIRLLTVSIENQGKHKKFDRIAGNLLAYVAKIAVRKFGELACVSLRPKTEIAQHYIRTYNMIPTGLTLSIEMPEILHLIKKFDHD